MSENTPKDPFAAPSGYAGAGKRARRVEPDSDPVGVEPAEETPRAGGSHAGESHVPSGLEVEHDLWNDIFAKAGSDPSLTATGAFPVVDAAAVELPPVEPMVPTAQAPEIGTETYDPFADAGAWAPQREQRGDDPGQESGTEFPPVTVDGQGLAEYTVEVPVQSPRGIEARVRAADPEQPPAPWASAAETTMQIATTPVQSQPAQSQETPVANDPADSPADPTDPPVPAEEPLGPVEPEGDAPDPHAHEGHEEFGNEHPDHPEHEDDDHFLPVQPGRRRAGRGEVEDEHGHRGDGGRSRLSGCLLVLVVLAVVGAGLYFAVDKGMDWVRDQFSSAEDFEGPGKGKVYFEIKSGETGNEIARNLKAAGVIASVQAYTDAAATAGSEKTNLIQPGTYALAKQMAAADVVNALIDPANRSLSRVTIPEGLRAVDIVEIVAKKTELKKGALTKALKDGEALGLPDFANGNPEGFLFPATYEVSPKDTAASLLKKMVDRWHQADQQWDLEASAKKLDITPYELMTVASLVQAEGRGKDMNKIARVIYNRLDNPTGPSAGFLGIDASINYGLDQKGVVALTAEQLAVDTPYNTRLHKGLPPTPINNMGDEAMEAAANPADGPWEWYVTVNLKTGETKFTDSYEEFGRFKDELNTYCATSDAC